MPRANCDSTSQELADSSWALAPAAAAPLGRPSAEQRRAGQGRIDEGAAAGAEGAAGLLNVAQATASGLTFVGGATAGKAGKQAAPYLPQAAWWGAPPAGRLQGRCPAPAMPSCRQHHRCRCRQSRAARAQVPAHQFQVSPLHLLLLPQVCLSQPDPSESACGCCCQAPPPPQAGQGWQSCPARLGAVVVWGVAAAGAALFRGAAVGSGDVAAVAWAAPWVAPAVQAASGRPASAAQGQTEMAAMHPCKHIGAGCTTGINGLSAA